MDRTIHIIIPCYNMERYVGETIASVQRQNSGGWDCIIVDDGSTDRSAEIIDSMTEGDSRFRVLHLPNQGVAAARNRAIEEAGGGFILPLDADDRLMPYAMGRFAVEWKRNPSAALLVPQIRRFGEGIVPHVQERHWRGYDDLKYHCSPTNSSCYRYSDWRRVGGYASWSQYEDWEFWLRLLYKNAKVVNIPAVLVEYRIRAGSRFQTAVKDHMQEVELIRKHNPEIYNL